MLFLSVTIASRSCDCEISYLVTFYSSLLLKLSNSCPSFKNAMVCDWKDSADSMKNFSKRTLFFCKWIFDVLFKPFSSSFCSNEV